MQITYENSSGESLTLWQRRPYFLSNVDGTGQIRQNILTFKAPNQDGAFYISGNLDMRNITLDGTIVANCVDEAATLRQRLFRIFSPKKSGLLTYRNKQIPCRVEEIVFAQRSSARVPSFFISLLCPSPFFEDIEELRVELAAWTAKFRFAFEIPESGMEFGVRQPSQIISVDNDGDVPCGCSIQFRALGSVVRVRRTM